MLSRPQEDLSAAECLLVAKYRAVLDYAVRLQTSALLRLEGSDVSKSDVLLQGAWIALHAIRALERESADEVRELLAAVAEGPARARPKLTGEAAYQVYRIGEVKRRRQAKFRDQNAAIAAGEKAREKDLMARMIRDPALALAKGHVEWNKRYWGALKLRRASNSRELTPDETRKVGCIDFYRDMWSSAHEQQFPREAADPRKPAAGYTVILDGERRPAGYEILTNTGGVIKKYRSRKYSTPHLRMRHKFHDMVMRSRGAERAVRPEATGGYKGESSGINPRASHSDKMGSRRMV